MLIDGSHKAWCWTTLGLLAAASGAYAVYARTALDGPRGGSVPGLLFGIAGSALMIYAGLISARKKAPTWRIGSAQTWLRGHLWLGSLSVPLILFHAGFRWGGPLEQALLLVFAAIVASGVFGLILQQFVPRQITSRVPLETFYAQVPHVCRVLQLEADVAVAQLCGPLPLAAEASDDVATAERLNLLGVSGKNPLAAVYASTPSSSPKETATATTASHQAKPATAATRAVRDVAETPSAEPAPKAISASDKIALMRAGKAANKPALTPAADNPSAVAAETPKPSLSAADKIAMMRAAKAAKQPDQNPAGATKQEASADSAAEKPKPSLSAADKIAMMRAAKAAKQPGPPPAADQAPVTAPGEDAAPEKPKQSLSAAEKIAMMRAAKTGKPAAQPTVSTASTESASAPAPAAPAAKPASAAEKIALMRAGKAALSGKSATGAAPPAAAATAAKPAPAPKPAPAAKPAPAVKRQKPADDAWKQACPEFVKFYLDQVRPFLGVRYVRQSLLADGVQAEGQFAAVGAVLPDELRPVAERLAALCEERRQLAAQVRMHHWLHGWLLLHVPLSLTLLALGVVHVVASLYY